MRFVNVYSFGGIITDVEPYDHLEEAKYDMVSFLLREGFDRDTDDARIFDTTIEEGHKEVFSFPDVDRFVQTEDDLLIMLYGDYVKLSTGEQIQYDDQSDVPAGEIHYRFDVFDEETQEKIIQRLIK